MPVKTVVPLRWRHGCDRLIHSKVVPARIISISKDEEQRNATLGQGLGKGQLAEVYNVRLRTANSNLNGLPAISSSEETVNTELTHIVYTLNRKGQAHIYIDGVQDTRRTEVGQLAKWNMDYPLTLANERTGDRPWLGAYDLVAVYCVALAPQEVLQNYASGPDATEPQTGQIRLPARPARSQGNSQRAIQSCCGCGQR